MTTGTITGEQVRAAIVRVAVRLGELGDLLNRLDAAVGDGDLDHVAGMVTARAVLTQVLSGETIALERLLQPPLILHEWARALQAFEQLRQSGAPLAIVNALGDIWDRGHIVVGALRPDGAFVDQTQAMLNGVPSPLYSRSTTIAVVATTERLSKAEANRVAKLADDGMARAISPNHTQWDGDTIFCLALGSQTSDMNRDSVITIVGTAAATVLEQAIIRGALAAQGWANT
jgi:hypothetical protein